MANNAFDQANSAIVLAQSAYDKANTPAGSDTQVQFNDGGDFGASSNFTFNKTTGTLSVNTLNIVDDLNITNNIVTEGNIVPTDLGQNIGNPSNRWYNLYLDGGIYASGSFGNPGQILQSDGYGTVEWVDAPSANVDGNVVVYAIDQVARGTANSAQSTAQAAFNKANTGGGVDQYARSTANTAYTNTIIQQGVNLTQNTNNTNTNVKAQAAFDKANTATNNAASASLYANNAVTLAQAAYNQANTGGGGGSGIDQYARNTANTAYNSTVYLQSVNDGQNTSISDLTIFAQAAFSQANTGTGSAAAFDKANSANVLAQAAFNQGNSTAIVANTAVNNAASSSLYANTGINNAASASSYANTGITLAQAAFDKANTGTGSTAAFDKANSANVLAQSAFDKANTATNNAASASLYANTGITLAQAAYNQGNSTATIANNALANTTSIVTSQDFTVSNNLYVTSTITTGGGSGGNISGANTITANTIIANNVNLGTYVQSAYDYANTLAGGSSTDNTARILAQAAFNSANSGSLYANTGINNAASASSYANTGITLAQSAYDYANGLSGGSSTGNTIALGSNTQGLLVSNAVTLTTETNVTNGLALLNQVLGKLVPSSPPSFPNSNTLTISSTVGPYRMADFTQTDNTVTGGKSVAGGTSRSVRRAATYSTNTLNDMGPGDTGVLSIIKNSSNAGGLTLTTSSANGTYGDLVVSDSVDYSVKSGGSAGFWRSFDSQASGTVSSGWNEIYIAHNQAGNTSTTSWYYDAAAPGTPTFTSASIVPLSASLTYSSTVPHYNSSTTFRLGVNVSKLSGDMYPSSDTFFTGTAGGAFQAPASNTYSGVGITTPLARNLYVSSGSVTVNTTASITSSAFGSSSTGPTVTVDNSYSTGTQVFTTALSNTVLYKTGTSSSMEETTVTVGSTIGVGSGLAARIINPGTTDTPTYTASASLFNSQTSTLTANDATIVAATLKHDQTNYSTGYLPAGPNLSSGRSGSQYFTFRFVRTSVSKFDIQFTGTIAGLWVALPGSTIDSSSTLNGWIDMSTAYAGSGVPGAGGGGNGSNGCALGGTVTLNSAVTSHRKTCTFGTVSSSSTATNEIYVRIKLTSGQSVSALSLQTASN